MGDFLEQLCAYTGFEMALPMNTGAEAVETAIKLARRWGAEVKGVDNGKQEIIVCEDNFHGRTSTIVSFTPSSLPRAIDTAPSPLPWTTSSRSASQAWARAPKNCTQRVRRPAASIFSRNVARSFSSSKALLPRKIV